MVGVDELIKYVQSTYIQIYSIHAFDAHDDDTFDLLFLFKKMCTIRK